MVSHDDRRAKFSQRAQPAEQQPGDDTGASDGQIDSPEYLPGAFTQCGRYLLESRVYRFKRGECGDNHEWRSYKDLRKHDPRERGIEFHPGIRKWRVDRTIVVLQD